MLEIRAVTCPEDAPPTVVSESERLRQNTPFDSRVRPYRGWPYRTRLKHALIFSGLLLAITYLFVRIGFLPWYVIGFIASGFFFVPALIRDIPISKNLALHHPPEFSLLFFMGYIGGALAYLNPEARLFVFIWLFPATFTSFLGLMLVVHWKWFPNSWRRTVVVVFFFWAFVAGGAFFGLELH